MANKYPIPLLQSALVTDNKYNLIPLLPSALVTDNKQVQDMVHNKTSTLYTELALHQLHGVQSTVHAFLQVTEPKPTLDMEANLVMHKHPPDTVNNK